MDSVVVDGKVLDFHYKKNEVCYDFYIGEMLIGQIFYTGRRNWSAVSWKKPCMLCPVHGFSSRHRAAEFLLKVNGYH